MSLRQQAVEFLAERRVAVVGVSRSGGTATGIYRRFRDTGYDVYPVNPNADAVDGVRCYPSVGAIPGGVDAVVIVTRPEHTEAVVQDCVNAGVRRVWMHHNALFGRNSSSVSAAAVRICDERGIAVIAGACPLMFGRTSDFGHQCMHALLSITGGLPEAERAGEPIPT